MANDVTLSAGVRANLLSLQNTATMMGKVQERLSTGKKVNSAVDNPVNFFTAASLQARSGDLSTLLDGVSNAIQTVAAADKGISAITKLIESAKSTARQALTADEGTITYAANIQGGALADDAAVAAVDAGDLTIQVGNGTVHTITFGGASMDTQAELSAALTGLSLGTGITASFNVGEEIEIELDERRDHHHRWYCCNLDRSRSYRRHDHSDCHGCHGFDVAFDVAVFVQRAADPDHAAR